MPLALALQAQDDVQEVLQLAQSVCLQGNSEVNEDMPGAAYFAPVQLLLLLWIDSWTHTFRRQRRNLAQAL